MNEQTTPSALNETDRYVSFCGIDCDGNAAELITTLDNHVQASDGDPRWVDYFQGKRKEQVERGQDNLYFVGSQVNALYAYLESCEDSEATDLLWKLEQECC
ncbi:MAG: N(2)-fixation sustaining protein CowN [Oceanobacter sp.]